MMYKQRRARRRFLCLPQIGNCIVIRLQSRRMIIIYKRKLLETAKCIYNPLIVARIRWCKFETLHVIILFAAR